MVLASMASAAALLVALCALSVALKREPVTKSASEPVVVENHYQTLVYAPTFNVAVGVPQAPRFGAPPYGARFAPVPAFMDVPAAEPVLSLPAPRARLALEAYRKTSEGGQR